MYTKCGGEASPRPFFEKLKVNILLDPLIKILCSLFLFYVKLRAIEIS